MAPWLAAIRSSRLFHFVVLGGLIFPLSRSAEDDAISIDKKTLELLEAEEAHKLGVPSLTPAQAKEVEAHAVSDAILVREARRMGLEKEDRLVQQRLAQKVLFLAEDMGGASQEPTEADLRAFFETSRAQYMRPERFHFVHVVVKSEEDAKRLAPSVTAWVGEGAPPLGEPLPISRNVDARADEISVVYGDAFVASLRSAPVGGWSSPLTSKLGVHLVKVIEHGVAQPATFDEVKASLPLDYLVARREAAVARYLATAVKRYRIDVDGKRITSLPAMKRTAAHAQASLED